MADDTCPTCLGVGYFVRTEPYEDEDGYIMNRQVQVPCTTCHGSGRR